MILRANFLEVLGTAVEQCRRLAIVVDEDERASQHASQGESMSSGEL